MCSLEGTYITIAIILTADFSLILNRNQWLKWSCFAKTRAARSCLLTTISIEAKQKTRPQHGRKAKKNIFSEVNISNSRRWLGQSQFILKKAKVVITGIAQEMKITRKTRRRFIKANTWKALRQQHNASGLKCIGLPLRRAKSIISSWFQGQKIFLI